AVHAGLRRRDAGERRVLHRRVAVAAVDAVAGDVALVAELNRLLARDARFGDPRRSVHGVEEPEEGGDEENRAEDADPSNRVGAAVKDLWHLVDRRRDGSASRRTGCRRWERAAGRRTFRAYSEFRFRVRDFYFVNSFTLMSKGRLG